MAGNASRFSHFTDLTPSHFSYSLDECLFNAYQSVSGSSHGSKCLVRVVDAAELHCIHRQCMHVIPAPRTEGRTIRIQDHLVLHSKLEASLGYTRPCSSFQKLCYVEHGGVVLVISKVEAGDCLETKL